MPVDTRREFDYDEDLPSSTAETEEFVACFADLALLVIGPEPDREGQDCELRAAVPEEPADSEDLPAHARRYDVAYRVRALVKELEKLANKLAEREMLRLWEVLRAAETTSIKLDVEDGTHSFSSGQSVYPGFDKELVPSDDDDAKRAAVAKVAAYFEELGQGDLVDSDPRINWPASRKHVGDWVEAEINGVPPPPELKFNPRPMITRRKART